MGIQVTSGIKQLIKGISILLFLAYIIILSYFLFLSPFYGRVNTEMYTKNVNLQFFKTINNYIKYRNYVNISVLITNLAGNIIAFIPMGYFIPVIFHRTRGLIKILTLSAFISLSVELIQYRFAVGVFDVDDIILNTLGGIVGYILYKILRGLFLKQKKT